MSKLARSFSCRLVRIAVLAMLAGVLSGISAPADAHKRHRSAYVVGTHFPFVSGYRYHPSGFWYSANLSGCRYAAENYRYRRGIGYVYHGPNHGYYRHPQVRHYQPRRHRAFRYRYRHYEPRNRGIFTGGFSFSRH